MNRTISISAKIGLVVLILVGSFATSVTINVINGIRQSVEINAVADIRVPAALEAQAASHDFENALKLFEEAILNGEEDNLDLVDEAIDELQIKLSVITERISAVGVDTIPIITTSQRAVNYAKDARALFELILDEGFGSPKVGEASRSLNALGESISNELLGIREENVMETKNSLEGINQRAENFWKLGLIIFGVSLFFSVGLALFLVRFSILKPLLNRCVHLDSLTDDIKKAADYFKSASLAITNGAAQSAGHIEDSSSALTEMASLTESNADRAQNTKKIAESARDSADKGTQSMEELSKAMSAILDSSEDISKIVGSIDELAFQTNILALNAAIEAASAGEAGAGFAVVAEEVRSLAQRSAEAAQNTAGLVKEAITRSAEGSDITEQVGEKFEAIVGAVHTVDLEIAQITLACQEQTLGISQISNGLNQLEAMTQEHSKLSQKTSDGARSLNNMTGDLSEISTAFNTLAKGGKK